MRRNQRKTRKASNRKKNRAAGARRNSKSKSVIDISRFNEIEEELQKYKQMVDAANHGCAIANVKGDILYVNDSFARMHGYNAGGLLGRNMKIFHNAEQLKHIRAVRNRIIKTGKGLNNEEIWHKHRDGTVFPMLMSTWLMKDKSGRPVIECATAVDISELRQRETELEASKKILKTMLNASGDLIAMVDRDIKFIDLNERMADAFGQPMEKLIGRCAWDSMPPKAIALRRPKAERILATGEPVTYFDEDDKGRIYSTSGYPLKGLGGKVTGIVVFARDVTQHNKAEAELCHYREELFKLRRSAYLDLFGAIVGHQLSQPLTIINVLMEEMAGELESGSFEKGKIIKLLKTCLKETKAAGETIKKMREYTRQWIEGRVEHFSPYDVIKEVVSSLGLKARRAKIRIEVTNPKFLPTIAGHRNAFEQMVLNITENAIEAADQKKWYRLVISAEKTDKHIELTFSDDCRGIAKENLGKIFEPFYSTKTHRGGKSLGLGLPIISRILTTMGGEIRVKSTAGKGTTFYVNWPLK